MREISVKKWPFYNFLIVSKKSLMMYTVASITKPSPVGNKYVVKAFWHHGKPIIQCSKNEAQM